MVLVDVINMPTIHFSIKCERYQRKVRCKMIDQLLLVHRSYICRWTLRILNEKYTYSVGFTIRDPKVSLETFMYAIP
jgi:hypothetical protein